MKANRWVIFLCSTFCLWWKQTNKSDQNISSFNWESAFKYYWCLLFWGMLILILKQNEITSSGILTNLSCNWPLKLPILIILGWMFAGVRTNQTTGSEQSVVRLDDEGDRCGILSSLRHNALIQFNIKPRHVKRETQYNKSQQFFTIWSLSFRGGGSWVNTALIETDFSETAVRFCKWIYEVFSQFSVVNSVSKWMEQKSPKCLVSFKITEENCSI